MILYNLKKNKNKKMPNAYGKYYAYLSLIHISEPTRPY